MCEIKANTGNALKPEKKDWDLEKMQYLLEQNYVQYALWLNFFHLHTEDGNGLSWSKPMKDKELWICAVRLPSLKK